MSIGWAGLRVKSQVIWDREAHGMGDLNGSFAPQHDVIWFASKDGFAFAGMRPKSVIRSMRLGGEELVHPNEKPVDLMEQLIEPLTSAGDLVCDPFLGSGSAGRAAVRLGRRFVGMDTDPNHFATARDRIEAETCRHPLFAEPEAIQTELFAPEVQP